jgi:nicotinamide riboside transporter PnuC
VPQATHHEKAKAMIPHIDVIVSLVSAAVYVLLIFKTRAGFVLGLANQGLWVAFMLQTQQFGLIYSIIFFTGVNVYGFWRWTKYPPRRAHERPAQVSPERADSRRRDRDAELASTGNEG